MAPAAETPKPPTVVATKVAEAPQLDGDLGDAAWQGATWYGDFTVLDRVTQRADPQTRFKVVFDDAGLYFGVECFEPNVGELRADCTERDGRVHSDDCVEIMVDPTGQRVEYYHFTVNSIGTLYDAELRQGGNVRSEEWDCHWQARTHVGDRSWTVEAAIPFVELGLSGQSAGAWAVNVTRERQAGRPELSSFAPTTGGFHQPARYAALELPGANLQRFFWEINRPFEEAVRQQDGRLVYRAKVHVTNQTGRLYPIELVPRLIQGDQATTGEAVPDMLDAGQSREYAFSVPLPGRGAQVLTLNLRDRRRPEQVFAVRSVPVTLEYVPLEIILRQPPYRNSIYATQPIEAVEAQVKLSLSPEEMAALRAVVTLRPAVGAALSGRPALAEAGLSQVAAEFPVRLPIPGLEVGQYEFRVELVDRDGQVQYAASAPLHKLPPAPNGHEWRLDENRVLLHNGEPYLPFGWFSIPPAEMAKPDHPYTAMQAYSSYWFPVDKVRAFLDEVAAARTFVTIYPYQSPQVVETEAMGRPLSEEEARGLRERVAALKDHPGLLAWYMADEPELQPALPERMRRLRDVVAEEDPYHPCIMLNDTIAGIHKYADGGDILMPDPYPCFIKGGLAAQPIEKVSEFMKACQEASQGRKAVWVTPQGFNYGDYGRQGQRGPTLTELRNMAYQAVIHGAKGFLWYTFSQVGNYPELNLGMPFLAREVLALKEFVLAPEVPFDLQVKAPQREHVHASLRRVGEEWVLFAVNTATEAQTVEFSLPAEMGDPLFVISENRTAPVQNGRLTDDFALYATHLYTNSERLAGGELLAEVQQAIDQANAARKKPGNLAFEDSGVTVGTSSNSTYGSTPDRVVDGVLTNMKWQDGTPKQFPDWITLTWPTPQTIGRVVVYTPTLADYEVQVPGEGEQWRTVAAVQDADANPTEVSFEPVETQAVRIWVTKLRPEAEYSQVWEIEAYGE